MRVHPQAPLSQACVLGVGGMASLGEMGEERVAEQQTRLAGIGLLACVERPHQHAKRVSVGSSRDLQGHRQQAQAGAEWVGGGYSPNKR